MACNSIIFNLESSGRRESFFTRKITHGLANIAKWLGNCLYMGNPDALRGWGHAKNYVRMQFAPAAGPVGRLRHCCEPAVQSVPFR